MLARLAHRLLFAPVFPRVLSVSVIALGLTVGSANAQLFGKNGPSLPAPRAHLPSSPRIGMPQPPRQNLPRPLANFPKPPAAHVPHSTVPPVRLPPVHVPSTRPPGGPHPHTHPLPGPKPTPGHKPHPGPNGRPNGNSVVIVIPSGLLNPPGRPVVPVYPVVPVRPVVVPVVPVQPLVQRVPVVPVEPTVVPATADDPPPAVSTGSTALRVTERVIGGPAAKAGIQLGYIIVKVGDIRVKTVADLKAALAALKVKVVVIVFFNPEENKLDTCEVTLDGGSLGIQCTEVAVAIDEEPAAPEEPEQPGAAEPTGETAVQITDVTARGIAARAGLSVGDVIITVNGKRVGTPGQLVALLKEAGEEAEVVFVNPDDGKAEKRTLKAAGGEIGVKVRTVQVGEK